MKKTLVCLSYFLFLCPALAFAATKPLQVVATFSIVGDLAQQVGGDLVQVKTLVAPDSDSHSYKPTPSDAVALSQADIVIENGLGMEGWIKRLVKASGFKGSVVVASKNVVPRYLSAEDNAHGHSHDHKHEHEQSAGQGLVDPHAWQDVSNVRIYVKNIAAALAKANPAHAETFLARAQSYDAELQTLDAWVRAEIGTIPTQQRKIVISHDSLGYFGAAYGVTFLAPQGMSTEIEPTATQVAKLIQQMKTEKIKRVFFETMASPKLIQQLAKDANASVGKPIYSDALSPADGPAPTYTAMVRHNVTQFKEAMALNSQ